jgi:DNA-directed RNA polymerase subunit delta
MAAPIRRVIKDYKSLGQEHIDLINEHFPNGFENEHLVSFTTPKGQFIKALEIRTEDTIYLFKIDKNMRVDDEENQENEGMAMGDFDNFKGGDDDSDSNEEEDDDTDDAPEESNEDSDGDEDEN